MGLVGHRKSLSILLIIDLEQATSDSDVVPRLPNPRPAKPGEQLVRVGGAQWVFELEARAAGIPRLDVGPRRITFDANTQRAAVAAEIALVHGNGMRYQSAPGRATHEKFSFDLDGHHSTLEQGDRFDMGRVR